MFFFFFVKIEKQLKHSTYSTKLDASPTSMFSPEFGKFFSTSSRGQGLFPCVFDAMWGLFDGCMANSSLSPSLVNNCNSSTSVGCTVLGELFRTKIKVKKRNKI